MRVTAYGVRGSIATPGPSTVRYGGNTVCVEVRLLDGSVIVLDAGTGIRELGRVLLAEEQRSPLHLLITHAHWDHIIGLPFFGPIWQRSARLVLYPLGLDAHRVDRLLFDEVHFPVRAADIPAQIDIFDQNTDTLRIGSAVVSRVALNHPGGAQGFRIDDADGASVCYITDHELRPPGVETTTMVELARFCRGARLLVHDAQYLESDMPQRQGWGHSVVSDVLAMAALAEVGTLMLFHHEPDRDDDTLDRIGEAAAAWMRERQLPIRVLVAREGMSLEVTGAHS